METPPAFVIKENWLTRAPDRHAADVTLASALTLILGCVLYWSGLLQAQSWMPASVEAIMNKGEYWRLWTTLLSHGDPEHLLSNMLLFVPFTYLLSGYFGRFLFPFLGILIGGLTTYLTLLTMGPKASLIGMSGVVYWMGATWLTLYLAIERRESVRRRLGKVLVISAILFFPQSFQPNVSYICHLFGFLAGIATGVVYYAAKKQEFLAAEVREQIQEEPEVEEMPCDSLEPKVCGF